MNINEKSVEEVKEEVTPVETPKTEEKLKMRQIIIETDGDSINIVKAEVVGRIELIGILQSLLGYVTKQK